MNIYYTKKRLVVGPPAANKQVVLMFYCVFMSFDYYVVARLVVGPPAANKCFIDFLVKTFKNTIIVRISNKCALTVRIFSAKQF